MGKASFRNGRLLLGVRQAALQLTSCPSPATPQRLFTTTSYQRRNVTT